MGAFLRSDRAAVTASAAPTGRRAQSAPYGAERPILAAAEQVDLARPEDRISARARPYSAWQREAWEGYEAVGEVHYGFNLLANLLSRARLYPGQIGQANEAPIDLAGSRGDRKISARLAKAATGAVEELLSNGGTDLIRNYALNLSVPGECYLIHLPKRDGSKVWTIRSCEELEPFGDGYRLNPIRNSAAEMVSLSKETFVARMWRMNPRFSREPDSSMLGVRNPVKTLLMLERLVRTTIRSRLNAGILFVPDTITSSLSAGQTNSAPETPVEEPGSLEELAAGAMQDDGNGLLRDLIESMSAPITDETNAAALVPMLLKGPQDAGEKINHIHLTRPSDEWLVRQADTALERVLNGIDIPKEIVTGLQQVRYSNAVVIDENLYKSNIEPLALALVDGLTTVFLRPKMLAMGFPEEEVRQLVIWYDPSDIVTRPNSADDATEGFDRGLLNPTAWRREHGFSEADAPTEDDLVQSMLGKAQVLPEAAVLAMVKKVFGDRLDLEEFARQSGQQQQPGGQQPGDVLPFSRGKAPDADPQRTAVQQVGLR